MPPKRRLYQDFIDRPPEIGDDAQRAVVRYALAGAQPPISAQSEAVDNVNIRYETMALRLTAP